MPPGITADSLERLSDEIKLLKPTLVMKQLIAQEVNFRLLQLLNIAQGFQNASDRTYLSETDIELAAKSIYGGKIATLDNSVCPSPRSCHSASSDGRAQLDVEEGVYRIYGEKLSKFKRLDTDSSAGESERTYTRVELSIVFPQVERGYEDYLANVLVAMNQKNLKLAPQIIEGLRSMSNVFTLVTKLLNAMLTVLRSENITQRQRWNILVLFNAISGSPYTTFYRTANLPMQVLFELLIGTRKTSAHEHSCFVTEVSLVMKRFLERMDKYDKDFGEILSGMVVAQLSKVDSSHFVPLLTALKICNLEQAIVDRLAFIISCINSRYKISKLSDPELISEHLVGAREVVRSCVQSVIEKSRKTLSPEAHPTVAYHLLEGIFGEQITAMLRPISFDQVIPKDKNRVRQPNLVRSKPPQTAESPAGSCQRYEAQLFLERRLRLFHLFNRNPAFHRVEDVFDLAPLRREIFIRVFKSHRSPITKQCRPVHRFAYVYYKNPSHRYHTIVRKATEKKNSYQMVQSSFSILATF